MRADPEQGSARSSTRLLCLGNDILADDAFGSVVAERFRRLPSTRADVVFSAESGFRLLDYLLGVSRLVVIDTVLTGKEPPGTVRVVREEDLETVPGGSPHYTGLSEVLALGRALGLPVAGEVLIIAVEAADCTTVGGAMHPAVQAAVPRVIDEVQELLSPTPA